MDVLNATELFTVKWLILCYVNFILVKRKMEPKREGSKRKTNLQHNIPPEYRCKNTGTIII